MDIEQLTLVDICEQVLIRQGPTAVPELVQAVRNAGIDPGPDAAEVVMDALSEPDTAAVSMTDERWAWGPDLLLGRVFTHRLAAEEIEHDLVAVNPDLAALLALDQLPEFARLADQTPVEVGFGFGTGVGAAGDDGDDEGEDPAEGMTGVRPREAYDVFGSLELPLGTLSGYVAGDLLGLRMADAGIELSTVAEDMVAEDMAGEDAAGEDATGHAVAAGQHMQRIVVSASEKPVTVESAVLTVCAEEPELFTAPLPPVAELIGAFGLAHEADFLAEPGFDFRAASVARRVSHVAETYELDEDEALSVVALRSVYQRFDDVLSAANEMVAEQGTDAADGLQALFDTESGSERQVEPGQPGTAVGKLVPLLAEPAVAYALLAETLGDEDEGAATLGLMAETLEEQAERPARPALRWLRARAHGRLGEVLKAEQVLQASERAQPGWPPILLDLARYAADRSDATGALELLDRLGPDAPPGLVEVVRRFQPEPGPVLGRNQPCWCGSGRKFKQCHLHRVEQRPLEERAAWLYEKARWYVSEGPWQPLLLEAATERAAYARTEEEVRRRTLDPFVTDAVLFEGGAFEEFVEVRGSVAARRRAAAGAAVAAGGPFGFRGDRGAAGAGLLGSGPADRGSPRGAGRERQSGADPGLVDLRPGGAGRGADAGLRWDRTDRPARPGRAAGVAGPAAGPGRARRLLQPPVRPADPGQHRPRPARRLRRGAADRRRRPVGDRPGPGVRSGAGRRAGRVGLQPDD